ncbi:MAG: tRNA (guanosine(46)-N7)-methyltransferase TrmB [Bifidobacteriaceae bacterium]|jgi:tRNA (guanine-N7-)-methyltransferase|nr:tRNA (guanosine(46)-N7)-methyltransferase TrmB [Bifidobacteriaceae bacterium]
MQNDSSTADSDTIITETPQKRTKILSFVRRTSKLKVTDETALKTHGKQYLLDLPRDNSPLSVQKGYKLDVNSAFGMDSEHATEQAVSAKIVMEIGCGMGDQIIYAAENDKRTKFLGVEVYLPGIARIIKRASEKSLTNIKLANADATDLITAINDRQLDEVWVFFPDPWHKNKHKKRRLLTADFAKSLVPKLKPNGILRIATDNADYAKFIRTSLDSVTQLKPTSTDRFAGRLVTAFERKASVRGDVVFEVEYVINTSLMSN